MALKTEEGGRRVRGAVTMQEGLEKCNTEGFEEGEERPRTKEQESL